MKTKIYKVLSIALALAVIVSTCLCAIGTVSAAAPEGTIAPTLVSGTIDKGTELPNNAIRIYTPDFYDLSDYTKVTLTSGYKTYYHFYGEDQTWLGDAGGWKTDAEYTIAQITSWAPAGAKYFKVVVGEANNANVSPSTFPVNGLLFTLVPQTPEGAIEYFVSATGDDAAAGTEEAPMLTVKAAVDAAIAAGYDADDTVYVKTVGADAVNTGLPEQTAFADHSFKLVITAADATVPGTVAGDFELGGTTEVTYVSLTGKVHFSGENATIGEGAVLSGNNGTYAGQYSNTTNHVNTTKPTTIKISSLKHMTFGFMGSYYNVATYNHPLTVEIEDWDANYRNEVHGGLHLSTAGCKGIYNSLVNFKIDTSTTRLPFKASEAMLVMGDNFAFQVINSTGKVILKTGDTLTRLDSVTETHTNALDYIPAEKKYILTNNSGLKDILAFTDTAGKFAVTDPRYVVTATPATGDPIVSKDGFLTVPAGEYTITAIKPAETITYYVASEADGGASANDGKSAEKPLLTVAEAIAKVNEYGALPTDTLAIKVVGTAGNATWGNDVKCNASVIKVESNDTQNLSTIVPPANSATSEMGGLVEFDNIKIQGVVASGNPDRLFANGRSVTFGANAIMLRDNYALYPAHQLSSYNNTLTFTIKNAFKGQINLTHFNNNGITYKGDLNYIVDNANAAPGFHVDSAYDTGGANKINGNLNIAIYDASSVKFNAKKTTAKSHYVISGALQVITPGKLNADITNLATIGQNDTAPAGGVYHIINATNVPHVVELTDTVGTYKINKNLVTRDLVLIDEDGISTAIEGDTITVTAGTYKVAYAPAQATYYVDGSEGGDGSEDAPLATVADAIAAATAAGYSSTDTITVKVLGDVLAGDYSAYTFDLIIEGSDVLVPADPEVEGSVDTYRPAIVEFVNNKNLANNEGKTTTYKNVTIYIPGSGHYPSLGANSSNLVMEDTVRYSAGYLGVVAGSWNDGAAAKTIAGQTVEINGKSPVYVNLSNAGWSGRKYTDMVSLILNIKDTNAPLIQFNAGQGGSTTYEDVFINIKQTDGIKEFSFSGATIEGNLYILNSAGINLNEVTGFDARPDNTFVLNNTTNIKDIVAPTNGEYDGEFIINFESETQQVVITDAEGTPVVIEDGYFYLEEAGEYTIALECIEHAYDNACDADCNNCGETRTPADHVYDNACDADCNECGETRTPADHVYDNACDVDCNECGEVRTTAHVYDNDCDAECNECGETRVPADHVYDNDCDADCNECGETRVPADHVYDNACDADCNECGETRVPADHVYDNGCDVDCNECGDIRTTAHDYDNNCDADCNVCGETRVPADHVYDNDCDADCNECGETRVPADHVYDNACDADCNECGDTRVPADHVYDNACDADCNVCGETRVPADHVYDNNSDTDCNECGEIRQLGAQLIEEGGVTYYYYDGVKSDKTGLVEYEGKQIYINKGRFFGATGIVTVEGKKVYVRNGEFLGATGLVTIDGKKLYIRNGYFLGASGIVTLNGKKMYIRNGYFLGATGLVTIDGKKLYIRNGYFLGATGIVTLDGKRLYIRNGYFLGASGTVSVGGKTYKVVNGIVQ